MPAGRAIDERDIADRGGKRRRACGPQEIAVYGYAFDENQFT
jgi:hypothetical protein